MRLKSVNLAGFKSFVDPTSIAFNSDIAAVVGPNGCGKSNIVDAIRWVIGESSAKTLRGELISDVIFNGTDNRRSVSRASVELLFDNRDGRFGGEYASYSQIELRREIAVDHQSTYYINGGRCRRRDIQDMFLGTGFGTRGYAIIEQGIVSQLVQSSPEELREYLEEAAGVSKYRARRRETELKIQHTKDNLLRVEDQVIELNRQLTLLKRQARAAQRHQRYAEQLWLQNALLSTIHRRTKEQDLSNLTNALTQLDEDRLRLESVKTSRETELVNLREKTQGFIELRDSETAKAYSVNAEVSALEVSLKSTQTRLEELDQFVADRKARILDLNAQELTDQKKMSELEVELEHLNDVCDSLKSSVGEVAAQMHGARDRFHLTQSEREVFLVRFNDSIRARERSEERQQQTRRLIEKLSEQANEQRSRNVSNENDGADIETIRGSIRDLQSRDDALVTEVSSLEGVISGLNESVESLEMQVSQQREKVQDLTNTATSLSARLAATEYSSAQSPNVSHWVQQNQLNISDVLRDGLKVTDGWERAVEMVLGLDVDAFVLEYPIDKSVDFDTLNDVRVSLIEIDATQPDEMDLVPISNYVSYKDSSFEGFLQHVFTVDSVEEAFVARSRLKSYQSILTRDCVWVGSNWIRVDRSKDLQQGVVELSRQLADARNQLKSEQQSQSQFEQTLDSEKSRLNELRTKRDKLQSEVNTVFSALTLEQGNAKLTEMRVAERARQKLQYEKDLLAIEARLKDETSVLSEVTSEYEKAVEIEHRMAQQRLELDDQHSRLQESWERQETEYAEKRDQSHAAELKRQATAADLTNLRLSHEQRASEIGRARNDLSAFDTQSLELKEARPQLQTALENQLQARLSIEEKQREHQHYIDDMQSQQRTLSGKLNEVASEIDRNRERRESTNVEFALVNANIENLNAQVDEAGVSIEQIENALSDETTVESVQTSIVRIERQIARIGDINQTAVRELEQRTREKDFLESQVGDLNQALETLQAAISRIDTETRRLLNSTFDEVNRNLAVIFPKLFGGGTASLEYTGTSVLDSGVSMRASPPGKRNLSIKLLSGGEKALAAIAFVFAVFKLNPSPVCVLDEVDAPLDESNVGRFAELLTNMTHDTQFILITHNSRTMESANELVGITMEEPGISRVVAVNLEDAVSQAKA